MNNQNLIPDFKENICPNCGEVHEETLENAQLKIGCEHCMRECHFCGLVDDIDNVVFHDKMVRTYKGNKVIWKRGSVCWDCVSDPDWQHDMKRSVLRFDSLKFLQLI